MDQGVVGYLRQFNKPHAVRVCAQTLMADLEGKTRFAQALSDLTRINLGGGQLGAIDI
jgi:hypothetical protein